MLSVSTAFLFACDNSQVFVTVLWFASGIPRCFFSAQFIIQKWITHIFGRLYMAVVCSIRIAFKILFGNFKRRQNYEQKSQWTSFCTLCIGKMQHPVDTSPDCKMHYFSIIVRCLLDANWRFLYVISKMLTSYVWFSALEYVGPIPYDILKPVLECCTPAQLYNLEDFNPVSFYVFLHMCHIFSWVDVC